MNPMTFEAAYARLYGNEGGYTVDNGGPTKYGISQRSYPHEDIFNLTQERAQFLYRRDFWAAAGCDTVPEELKFELFDTAVNTSAPGDCRTAIKLLQRAAGMTGAEVDGVLGPHTLMAVGTFNPWRLLYRFACARIAYYTHLRDALWDEAGKGWMNRISNNGLAM